MLSTIILFSVYSYSYSSSFHTAYLTTFPSRLDCVQLCFLPFLVSFSSHSLKFSLVWHTSFFQRYLLQLWCFLLFLFSISSVQSCYFYHHSEPHPHVSLLSHLPLFSFSWYLRDGNCIPQTRHILFPSILCPPGILVSLLASVAAVIYWTCSFFSGFYLDHNFGWMFQNIHFLSLLFFFPFNFCPHFPYLLYNYSGHSFLFSAAVLCPLYTSSLFLYCISHSSPKNFHAKAENASWSVAVIQFSYSSKLLIH